jgi:fructokinase
MSAGNYTIIGLGELLWDIFPQGKQLGGAPANFAYITSLLGDHGIVASRVGADDLGEEATHRLQHLRLPTDFLQIDSRYPTGTVNVCVDSQGQPQYEITEHVAWDFFELTREWRTLAGQAAAICFGTLAQRSPASRRAIVEFLKAARPSAIRVFDVNLRQSFFSADVVLDSAKRANIIKLNHEELPRVLDLLDAPGNIRQAANACEPADWLLRKSGADLICITRGDKGSLLFSRDGLHEHKGLSIQVADTVGAGDAFTAALVHHYLRRTSLETMNEAANRMGAWVASNVGATPEPDSVILEQVRNPAS